MNGLASVPGLPIVNEAMAKSQTIQSYLTHTTLYLLMIKAIYTLGFNNILCILAKFLYALMFFYNQIVRRDSPLPMIFSGFFPDKRQ